MGMREKLRLRARLAKVRMYLERQALASFGARNAKPGGRLLCYHSVGQAELGVNDCSPRRFRSHIELAIRRGHRFVPAAQIASGRGGARDLAITFDDGWKSIFTIAAPVLREFQIPSTLFVATGLVDDPSDWHRSRMLTWEEIVDLSETGMEIGSHSISHPDFRKIDDERIVDELITSRIRLKSRLGLAINGFAIPFGQSNNWTSFAHRAALQAGYELIYAQAENTRPPGTIARTFVTSMDDERIFDALLQGAFDEWEEWY
jgi:peptidoglycan/xylan/chitin deacetylase (PgdA/CDA1 family)